ncbi:MAG: hypothetical protein IJS61_05480 [Firmicutes bacterium]|nr:hypothetical protein [Bacillota bacterium]
MFKENPLPVKISQANKAKLFDTGLEYNPPARGGWNIVHTGMLLPEAREIFVCPQGCLRGVILTAAEMGTLDRLSSVVVSEEEMFDGSLEENIAEGSADILDRLEKKPSAVLLYISCIHLFTGCDIENVLSRLRERYPDIDFTDCYMTPTMREEISPDVKMRIQLYSLIKPLKENKNIITLVGNDMPPDTESEIFDIIERENFRDIHFCNTYSDYLSLGETSLFITTRPSAKQSGEILAQRLGRKHLYLPVSFNFENIEKNYSLLCTYLGVLKPDFTPYKEKALKAFEKALATIGDTPIVVDFLAVARPFELAHLLCEQGFNVKYVIADALNPEEEESFEKLKKYDIDIYPSVNVNMIHRVQTEYNKILSIGQKGAFYFETDFFVNMVYEDGLYGYHALCRLALLMEDAFLNPKDRNKVLKYKGHFCSSCLN